MSKFDQKIPIGSVPNGRSQIANRCAIRWFKCKLKPLKKEERNKKQRKVMLLKERKVMLLKFLRLILKQKLFQMVCTWIQLLHT